VEHTTTFDYDGPARASYNEIRQVPVSTPRQTALEWKISTLPAAVQYPYRDYWGTRVVAFNVDAPHQRLSIQSTSLVDTHPDGDPGTASWAEIAPAVDRHIEFCEASRYTEATPELVAVAAELRRDEPAETVEAVAAWVHSSLEYLPGVTHVHTPAHEAFEAGRGVCQDFAHLALCVLRAAGVPCRYVSGYLHPELEAEVGTTATGESHAWVEAWTGAWWGLDPTAGTGIGLRHAVVARGRDYADVAPVRGIYAGGAQHETSVAVAVTRTA
jgi:transglutaminase-like putative cysteine protease